MDLPGGTVFEGGAGGLALREVHATVVLVDDHGRKASHRAGIVLRVTAAGFEVVSADRLVRLLPVPIDGRYDSPPAPTHAILMDERGAILWWAPLSRIRRP